jgi:hypothetical protein
MSFPDDHKVETFKSLITISIEGHKALLLINGGAVVALLAFLGQSNLGQSLVPHAWVPISCFVAGTAFATFAFLGSYATQFALHNEHVSADYRGPRHMTLLYVTLAVVILSLSCFAVGSFASLRLFSDQSSRPATPPPILVSTPTTSATTPAALPSSRAQQPLKR